MQSLLTVHGGGSASVLHSSPMSIFRKKGTVEGLYRIGPTVQPTDHEPARHEVFYVRGRPFIAPTAGMLVFKACSNLPAAHHQDCCSNTLRVLPCTVLSQHTRVLSTILPALPLSTANPCGGLSAQAPLRPPTSPGGPNSPWGAGE